MDTINCQFMLGNKKQEKGQIFRPFLLHHEISLIAGNDETDSSEDYRSCVYCAIEDL